MFQEGVQKGLQHWEHALGFAVLPSAWCGIFQLGLSIGFALWSLVQAVLDAASDFPGRWPPGCGREDAIRCSPSSMPPARESSHGV